MKIWIPEEAAQTDHPPQHRTAMFMSSSSNKTNVNHEALPNLVQSQQRQTTTSCQKNKNIAETSHPRTPHSKIKEPLAVPSLKTPLGHLLESHHHTLLYQPLSTKEVTSKSSRLRQKETRQSQSTHTRKRTRTRGTTYILGRILSARGIVAATATAAAATTGSRWDVSAPGALRVVDVAVEGGVSVAGGGAGAGGVGSAGGGGEEVAWGLVLVSVRLWEGWCDGRDGGEEGRGAYWSRGWTSWW